MKDYDSEFSKQAQELLEILHFPEKIDLIFNANYRLYQIGDTDPKEMKLFKEMANKGIEERIEHQKSLKELYLQIDNDLAMALFSPNKYVREIAKIIKNRKTIE